MGVWGFRTTVGRLILAGVLGALAAVASAPVGAADITPVRHRMVSLNNRGAVPNDSIIGGDASRTGRYVLFDTTATNMPDASSKPYYQRVYLRDRRTGRTRLVSRATDGRRATGSNPRISPNGRFVGFCSRETLVKPDRLYEGWYNPNYPPDMDFFVRDLRTGQTRRASTTWNGGMGNAMSCGNAVADNGDAVFMSYASNLVRRDGNGVRDAFLYDWSSGTVRRLSRGMNAFDVTVSGKGRYAALITNNALVKGDTNGVEEPYVLDRERNRWSRAARRSGGGQIRYGCVNDALDLSYTGRFITYGCYDGALVSPAKPHGPPANYLYLTDRRRGRTHLINRPQPSLTFEAAVSDDGASVLWLAETDGYDGSDGAYEPGEDVYLWRRGEGYTAVTPGENVAASSGFAFTLTGDGRFGLFTSDSPDISSKDPALGGQVELYLTTPLR